MKAWALTKYKHDLQLIEVAEPVVGPHDVLIATKAVGLNHVDDKVRLGDFKALMKLKLPFVLGHELAGEVLAVGHEVTKFEPGQRVYARPSTFLTGTLAPRASINEAEIALVSSGASFAEAAAVPLTGLTAWQALVDLGKVSADTSVLIHGGAGSVGIFAVQLAKQLGAHVTATAGPADLEFVRSLGADSVIDYRNEDFTKTNKKFDLVLDGVGGETLMKSFEVVRPGGRVIGLVGPADPDFARQLGANAMVSFAIKMLSRKVLKKTNAFGVKYSFLFMKPNGAQLSELTKLIDTGQIKTFVGKTFSFEEADKALVELVKGKVRRGKAVVVLD
ncbi:MAG: NADP-dependent oxidoreductase [Microbacteriaceae bacterium]